MRVNFPSPPGFSAHVLNPPQLGEGPWRVSALALDVSGQCNLACRYCAEASTQPRRKAMPEETLLAAWQFLFPDGRQRPGCSIRLGSGEPLLAAHLLRRLAELVSASPTAPGEAPPEVFLTTNGSLIDRKTEDWLVDSGWHVKVSLDGPAAVQDHWRITISGTGTHARVSAAVNHLAQRIPERLSATAVLCRGTDPALVFEHLQSLGVRRIEMVPAVHHDPAVVPGDEDLQLYCRFLEIYTHRILETGTADMPPVLVRFENVLRRVMGYDLKRVACGAGRTFIGVGPDGDLYPCFRFIGIPEFRIGDLHEGLDADLSTAFQTGPGRAYEQRPACGVCWAGPLCGGPCFACAEMFGPGDGEPVPVQCGYSLADAWWAVWLVGELRRVSPERLLGFLPAYAQAYLQDPA